MSHKNYTIDYINKINQKPKYQMEANPSPPNYLKEALINANKPTKNISKGNQHPAGNNHDNPNRPTRHRSLRPTNQVKSTTKHKPTTIFKPPR